MSTAVVENPEPKTTELEKSEGIIKHYALMAGGAGLVPLPFVNWAGVFTLQALMVSDIAKEYKIPPTTKERLRSVVVSLVASVFQKEVGMRVGRGLAFFVPVIGPLAGLFATPVMAWAATNAVGRVFTTHFESGGTFLDFDAAKVHAKMKSEYSTASTSTTKI